MSKKLKLLQKLAKYQVNIHIGKTLRIYVMIPLLALIGKSVNKWKQYFQGEALINSSGSVNNFSDFDVTNAKLDELNKWKTQKVYDKVDKFIDLWWVYSENNIKGELNVKSILNIVFKSISNYLPTRSKQKYALNIKSNYLV